MLLSLSSIYVHLYGPTTATPPREVARAVPHAQLCRSNLPWERWPVAPEPVGLPASSVGLDRTGVCFYVRLSARSPHPRRAEAIAGAVHRYLPLAVFS